jgi:hypothetical protein
MNWVRVSMYPCSLVLETLCNIGHTFAKLYATTLGLYLFDKFERHMGRARG